MCGYVTLTNRSVNLDSAVEEVECRHIHHLFTS